MRSHSLALASAVAAGAMAQSTSVTSLFLYGFEGENIVASVVSAAAEETTYSVTCAPGTDSNDCGFGPGITAIVKSTSIVAIHLTEADALTVDAECSVTSETEADCTRTIQGPEANSPGTEIGALVCPDCVLPVTITAGLEKFLAAGTAEPTGSAASGPSETGASGSSSATGTGASGSAATATSASNATESNGAVAGAGQNLILAGLSGIVGLVMAL